MDLPAEAPLKDKLNAERDKLRKMTFKGKLEYIWDYYKIPIICIIAGLILIVSLINTLYINPPPGNALMIAWSAGIATDEQLDKLKETLDERIVDEGANKVVTISLFIASELNPSFSMANAQRMLAMLAAGEIDLFITDLPLLKEYSNQEIIQPLDIVLDALKARNPAVYDRIEEKIVYASYRTEDGSTAERKMGINIGDSPLLAELGFYEQELIISISISFGNIEGVIRSFVAFFE